MAIHIRKSSTRGNYDYGWLKTSHSFSFNEYVDPLFEKFRSLRVMNEDVIAPKGGFPFHSHRNMEILTIVLEGELTHKDNLGNGSTLLPGEFQLMSAGKGVTHSEYNLSPNLPLHLYQIWILPEEKELPPRYQQNHPSLTPNAWNLIASRHGRDGSLSIGQQADIWIASLEKGKSLDQFSEKYGYLQLLKGTLSLNNTPLSAGDGASVDPGTSLSLEALSASEILFFHLD